VISSSICVATNDRISFIFIAEQYYIVYMYHIFFICSSGNEHLSYFQSFWLLWIVLQWTWECRRCFFHKQTSFALAT
jgi:hypothetical protein